MKFSIFAFSWKNELNICSSINSSIFEEATSMDSAFSSFIGSFLIFKYSIKGFISIISFS